MKILVYFTLVIFSLLMLSCSANKAVTQSYWHENYCRQKSVMPIEAGAETITAQIEGNKFHEYPIVEFPESFIDWNRTSRLDYLTTIEQLMRGEGSGTRLEGPHNGIVATSGNKRADAVYSLNNAVKGMGFIPKAEKMDEMIELLDSTQGSPMPQKLQILKDIYNNLEDNFALDRQGSLELYSQPQYMTQTFLNQMHNPASTIVFLDIPSYKLKTVARQLDPHDPQLTAYEKQAVTWINKIHNYFHGPFDKEFIAVVYFVLEVYDNSPRGEDPKTGMGRKIMPLIP